MDPLDPSKLPLPFTVLPDTVSCIQECARYEIQAIHQQQPLTTEIEDCLDDGFVLCDLAVIHNKYHAWKALFPRIRPYYAVKCHPDPMVVSVLAQLGAGFDCASLSELQLVHQHSLYSSIIYANPQRAERDLQVCGTLFTDDEQLPPLTFDGPEELYKIHRLYKERSPRLILRLLVPDGHAAIPLGEKFGASMEQVEELVLVAQSLHLKIVGVSFHGGSGNHDPKSYQVAIEMAITALKQIQGLGEVDCTILDIGGGFPGCDGLGADNHRFCGRRNTIDSSSTSLDSTLEIAKVVSPLLDELCPPVENNGRRNVEIKSEPGRYFVEAAFVLCSRIYRVRTEVVDGKQHRHYYIAQGVQGVFKDCILCHETFVPRALSLVGNEHSDLVPCTVHGPSGEDYDVICCNEILPSLEIGDWLIFDRMGAYTLSIASRNGRPPVRYVMGKCSTDFFDMR